MAKRIFERKVFIHPEAPRTIGGRCICVITDYTGGKTIMECWDEHCECRGERRCSCYHKTVEDSFESAEELLKGSGYYELKEVRWRRI